MKSILSFLLITVTATVAYAQAPAQTASGADTTVPNADGTTTVTRVDDQGNILQKSIVNPDGIFKRVTTLTYDTTGNCVSWKSCDARGAVDSGQLYVYNRSAKSLCVGVRGVDGSVLYQKQ